MVSLANLPLSIAAVSEKFNFKFSAVVARVTSLFRAVVLALILLEIEIVSLANALSIAAVSEIFNFKFSAAVAREISLFKALALALILFERAIVSLANLPLSIVAVSEIFSLVSILPVLAEYNA